MEVPSRVEYSLTEPGRAGIPVREQGYFPREAVAKGSTDGLRVSLYHTGGSRAAVFEEKNQKDFYKEGAE